MILTTTLIEKPRAFLNKHLIPNPTGLVLIYHGEVIISFRYGWFPFNSPDGNSNLDVAFLFVYQVSRKNCQKILLCSCMMTCIGYDEENPKPELSLIILLVRMFTNEVFFSLFSMLLSQFLLSIMHHFNLLHILFMIVSNFVIFVMSMGATLVVGLFLTFYIYYLCLYLILSF